MQAVWKIMIQIFYFVALTHFRIKSMKSLKILIVEDEIFIAETIKMYLEEKNYAVIGTAISYEEAFEIYNLQNPDLVLLDIRLYGDRSGIDFASFLKLQKNTPPYIFLTSQMDLGTLEQALETNPYGYLTKPFYKESLWTSIESAHHLFCVRNTSDEEVIITDGRKNHLIKISDIMYIEADHVYTIIYLTSGVKLTVRKTLQQILDMTLNSNLIYCHRSYIVNQKHIEQWNPDHIIMINGDQIPISRSKKNEIVARLKNSIFVT